MSSTKGKPDPKAPLETPTDLSADAWRAARKADARKMLSAFLKPG